MVDLDIKVLPLVVGLGVVVGTAILAKLYLGRKKGPPITLKDPTVKYPLELIEKEEISHDTRRFRFKLPSADHVLGLPIGQIGLDAHVNLEVFAWTPGPNVALLVNNLESLSAMSVSKVKVTSDAYTVCLHHALTTECEEIMGLLIGQFSHDSDQKENVTCNVLSAVTLRRSDKRKDRVEISPEMLIEAQQKAELMSAASNEELHIVGWYHSHPHITVWPSDIDLQTQAGYQQMDDRFIGLIFSVYNEDKKTKAGSHHLTCFQAVNQSHDGAPRWSRVSIPFSIVPSASITPNNQQALETLILTLFDEQKEIVEESRKSAANLPLVHLHNSAVMVRNVCALSQLIAGPLVSTLENEIQTRLSSLILLKDEAEYLKGLLKHNGMEPPT